MQNMKKMAKYDCRIFYIDVKAEILEDTDNKVVYLRLIKVLFFNSYKSILEEHNVWTFCFEK